MRKIIEIAIKDNRIRFSTWTELLFFLILPVLFTLFLGGGLGGSNAGGEADNRITVLVVDEDETDLSATFLDTLSASNVIRIDSTAREEAEERFEDGEQALLIIEAGFEDALEGDRPVSLILRKAPQSLTADTAERAIRTAAATVSSPFQIASQMADAIEEQQPFADEASRNAFVAANAATVKDELDKVPARLTVTQSDKALTEVGQFDLASFAAAGQLVTWVFIPLLGASGIFAYERVLGTMRRLVVSPTHKSTFMIGTIVGQLVAAIIQMSVLIILGSMLMGINWGNSPPALALLVVTFGLASVAMGTMLGTFVKTVAQSNGISVMLGMTMAMLGGCWFPIENFPATMRNVVQILPTTWAMSGFSDVVLRGEGVAAVLPEVGVLLGFAAVFFTIGIWRFRYE